MIPGSRMILQPILIALLGLLAGAFAQSGVARPVPSLDPARQEEARRLLDQIRRDPRGPFGPIRWYCADGRVLPPQGTPCRPDRGFQHASPSVAAEQLTRLDIDVARFLANMPFEEFLDVRRNHHWLRQIVLLDYLMTTNDGWIYKRTWSRRGVRQAEDEEASARRLLRQLLQDPVWLEPNYLLALQLTATLPHGIDTARVRRIRALSTELADQNPSFFSLRAKIHSRPGPEDISAVEAFVRQQNPTPPDRFHDLVRLMRDEYSLANTAQALPAFQKQLKGSLVETDLDALAAAASRSNREAFEAGSRLSLSIRRALTSPGPGTVKLQLADLQVWLLDTVFRYGASEGAPSGSRRERLVSTRHWLRYAAGAGLLSFRQLEAAEPALAALLDEASPGPGRYNAAIRDLQRTLEWIRASIVREFGPVQRHYLPVEPEVAGLIDELLRRSVALHLSRHAEELLADAEAVIGRRHAVLGQASSRGILALNPGLAVAPLDIVEPGTEAGARLDPQRIYVVPETLDSLTPVTGILTLDSGNALSHTQLLAANLGIPNATVPSRLLAELRKHRSRRMLYAVTPAGNVILRDWDSLPVDEQALWSTRPRQDTARAQLDSSRLRLDATRVIPLSEIAAADSGILAGPKAANVGELSRRFPGLVSAAIVVPFGVYHQHLQSVGGGRLAADIRAAFDEAERLRAGGAPISEIRAFINPKLARFREAIRAISFRPEFERDLDARLAEAFGPDGSYGVFVRSDTNAEDLPQFTGAGLNLTVPNVVGRARILQAIRDVWASPFEERAYEWRSRALAPGSEVYPSVLLQRTVNSEKSGVLVTVNLETLDQRELTVNANEGVAAVVDGGSAESLLLRPDGSVKLLAQARTSSRRVALPSGGFDVVASTGSDYVLQPDEIRKLRDLAAKVIAEYPKSTGNDGETLPWDIEFGFEKGELRLFQIRPLVRFRETSTLERLAQLEGPPAPASPAPVDLDSVPETP